VFDPPRDVGKGAAGVRQHDVEFRKLV
jgi:hypothetical protein